MVSLLLGLIWLLHPGADEYLTGFLPNYNDVPGASAYWWGFVIAAAATAAARLRDGAVGGSSAVELTVSGVGLIAVAGVLTSVVAQPVSYLFVLPALGTLVGTLIWLVVFDATLERLGPALVPVLGAVPALLVYMGLLRFFGAASLGISAYAMPIVALLMLLLVPPLETLRRVHRGLAPSVLGVTAVAVLAFGAFTIDIDPSTTEFGPVDQLASVADFEPVVFDRGDSPWTVGVVDAGDGRACLEASVADDTETGDIGWCPVTGDLRPTLDYQWGRTATDTGTNVPGARYGYVGIPNRGRVGADPVRHGERRRHARAGGRRWCRLRRHTHDRTGIREPGLGRCASGGHDRRRRDPAGRRRRDDDPRRTGIPSPWWAIEDLNL